MKLYKNNAPRLWAEASPEDIIAAFNDLPEWDRMCVAASVVEASAPSSNVDSAERANYLNVVGGLEAGAYRRREDAKKAQEAAEVEGAAKTIYADLMTVWTDELPDDLSYRLAKLGYRKRADDE